MIDEQQKAIQSKQDSERNNGHPVSVQLGAQGEQYLAMLKVHNSKVNNI
jgi:hypothetical protein